MDTDIGKFVVGMGHAGWFGGLVTKTHTLVVEQGSGRPLMSTTAAVYYLLVDPPPPLGR